ncbi:protein kinase domain-containing protein, partial [Haematococcus lacustris]
MQALQHIELGIRVPELDVLLEVVKEVWRAPACCITLLDSRRVWVSNSLGMGVDSRCDSKPWEHAMCPWTLLTPNPMALAVEDLSQDA